MSPHAELWWILILGGAFSGLLNGWLGLGGMSVFVPLLIWIFHGAVADHATLIPTVLINAFLPVVFIGAASWAVHHGQRNVRYVHVAPVALGAVAGTALGFSIAKVFGLLASMDVLFGVYLIAVGISSIWLRVESEHIEPNRARLVGIGIVGGTMGGLIGFNGNSVFIPSLRGCGLNVKEAIATGQIIGILVALLMTSGLGLMYGFERIDLSIGIGLSVAGIVGSYMGAWVKTFLSCKNMNFALVAAYLAAGLVLVSKIMH